MSSPGVLNGADLTLREAERILTAQAEQYAAHLREHELAIAGQQRAFDSHKEKHEAEQKALDKAEVAAAAALSAALAASDRATDAQKMELSTALDSHHREHLTHEAAHGREHAMTADALTKAESSMDKRLESIAKLLEERDKAWAVRFDDILRAITNVEKATGNAESVKQGNQEQRSGTFSGLGAVATIISIVIGTVTIVGFIIVIATARGV